MEIKSGNNTGTSRSCTFCHENASGISECNYDIIVRMFYWLSVLDRPDRLRKGCQAWEERWNTASVFHPVFSFLSFFFFRKLSIILKQQLSMVVVHIYRKLIGAECNPDSSSAFEESKNNHLGRWLQDLICKSSTKGDARNPTFGLTILHFYNNHWSKKPVPNYSRLTALLRQKKKECIKIL
jgi:hypothetical protein